MDNFAICLVLAAFATARISSILVEERGPFDICYHFRKRIGIIHDGNMDPEVISERFVPLLFSCVKCLSVWVGVVLLLGYYYLPQTVFLMVVGPFGLSGAAVLIDSMLDKG